MSTSRAPRAHAARGDVGAPRRTRRTFVRRIVAALTAVVLGAGLALVGVAGPASAHHNDIRGAAACVPGSETVDIAWSVTNSENREETITWSSDSSIVPVGTKIGSKKTVTFVQKGVAPGTTQTLELKAEWSNGQKASNRGETTVSSTICDDERPITICHATGRQQSPYEKLTLPVSAVVSGHRDHRNGQDVIPAFTYKGKSYTAQGDQSLLQFADCAKPTEVPVGGEPTFSDTCGVDNERLTVPTDTWKVDWSSS